LTTKQLYQELSQVDHSRDKRLKYANLILAESELISKLLEIVLMVDDKIAYKAAWVFEFTSKNDIILILPE